MERFTEYVRRLLNMDGEVDYHRRQHYFCRWAEAAERNGYLVDLTPFLQGASDKPIQLDSSKQCIAELEKDLVLNQATIPLTELLGAMASLCHGDFLALVTRVPGMDLTRVSFLEKRDGVVDAIHDAEGAGGIRSENSSKYAALVLDAIGVAIHRPRLNRRDAAESANCSA